MVFVNHCFNLISDLKESSVQAILFSELNLPPEQLANLAELGYAQMTPIQAQSLPAILNGQDVVAQAKTGSGKTAAFAIGLLDKIKPELVVTQALVLCPTRELADQVMKEIRRLARFKPNIKILSLCGGKSMAAQLSSLVHQPHIAVGTPGRIYDHLHKKTLILDQMKMLVLDEADRMLDMGFSAEMDAIIELLPKQRQTLLFSATYPNDIEKISRRIQSNPLKVVIEEVGGGLKIEQLTIEVEQSERVNLLARLLSKYQPDSCVVFCNTKRDCQLVEERLNSLSIKALALHGDLEQRDRDQVLLRFSNHSCRILVATDVAARGLDIKDLAMVVNFELPFDAEVYIHRIGRTGRAGQAGLAISFCTAQEMRRANEIEDYLQTKLVWQDKATFDKVPLVTLAPEMVTLCIDGGRKAKIRAGDILGALTGESGVTAAEVGKIDLFDMQAYVAIRVASVKRAAKHLQEGKIKGKNCRVRVIN